MYTQRFVSRIQHEVLTYHFKHLQLIGWSRNGFGGYVHTVEIDQNNRFGMKPVTEKRQKQVAVQTKPF